MTKHAVIIGAGSDIAIALDERLRRDGWSCEYRRHDASDFDMIQNWDLLLIASGTVRPIVSFWEADPFKWEETIRTNALVPLRQIRALYPKHNPGACVGVFAGSNPNLPRRNYSAYVLSKIMLIKAMEELQAESTDCKFFALGPGYVKTKIHQDTGEKGDGRMPSTFDQVYSLLKACIKGDSWGRNVHVRDDLNLTVLAYNTYKLRRLE